MADLMSQDEPSAPMPPAGAEPAPTDDGSSGGDDTTLVTICKKADGSYVVYAGDEPDAAGAGAPDDGSGGDMSAPAGMPADSVGAALKATLDLLKADEDGGDGGAKANFAAGFDGGSNASPAKPAMAPPA